MAIKLRHLRTAGSPIFIKITSEPLIEISYTTRQLRKEWQEQEWLHGKKVSKEALNMLVAAVKECMKHNKDWEEKWTSQATQAKGE